MEKERIQYLQMIQEVIARMSNISILIKGFGISIILAICAIIFDKEIKTWWLLIIFSSPLFSLIYTDIYYLRLEKKYRYLYENVRTIKKPVDFALRTKAENIDLKEAKADIINCLKSSSICAFYIPIIIMYLSICYWIQSK